MRSWLALLVLTGCGRFGFDESDPPSAPDDAASATPKICNARLITELPLTDESAIKIRGTALSTGHALAIQTDRDNTYMVRLDGDGELVATTLPFAAGYSLHGISQLADRPFVYVFTGGTAYIKLLTADWETYETGPSGEELAMDPQQARLPGDATAMFGVIAGGTLSIAAIDVDNATSGGADYAPAATFASFGAITSGVRVVVEDAGTCETFAIAPDGATSGRHAFSPCFEPRLATLGDQGAVLYQTSPTGPLAVHTIPGVASDPGITTVLERGSNPRIATIDGAFWAGYLSTTDDARLVRFTTSGVAMNDEPMIASSFELLASGAFWVTPAGALHAGDPCL